jgi:hypothetical protein
MHCVTENLYVSIKHSAEEQHYTVPSITLFGNAQECLSPSRLVYRYHLILVFGRCSIRISAKILTMLAEVFHGFS